MNNDSNSHPTVPTAPPSEQDQLQPRTRVRRRLLRDSDDEIHVVPSEHIDCVGQFDGDEELARALAAADEAAAAQRKEAEKHDEKLARRLQVAITTASTPTPRIASTPSATPHNFSAVTKIKNENGTFTPVTPAAANVAQHRPAPTVIVLSSDDEVMPNTKFTKSKHVLNMNPDIKPVIKPVSKFGCGCGDIWHCGEPSCKALRLQRQGDHGKSDKHKKHKNKAQQEDSAKKSDELRSKAPKRKVSDSKKVAAAPTPAAALPPPPAPAAAAKPKRGRKPNRNWTADEYLHLIKVMGPPQYMTPTVALQTLHRRHMLLDVISADKIRNSWAFLRTGVTSPINSDDHARALGLTPAQVEEIRTAVRAYNDHQLLRDTEGAVEPLIAEQMEQRAQKEKAERKRAKEARGETVGKSLLKASQDLVKATRDAMRMYAELHRRALAEIEEEHEPFVPSPDLTDSDSNDE